MSYPSRTYPNEKVERNRQILEMIDAGVTCAEVARIHGMSYNSVRGINLGKRRRLAKEAGERGGIERLLARTFYNRRDSK